MAEIGTVELMTNRPTIKGYERIKFRESLDTQQDGLVSTMDWLMSEWATLADSVSGGTSKNKVFQGSPSSQLRGQEGLGHRERTKIYSFIYNPMMIGTVRWRSPYE